MARRIALLAAAAALILAPVTVLAHGAVAKAPAARARVVPKAVVTPNGAWTTYHHDNSRAGYVFFFKQKTAYEIGLGIPAEPLFRSVSFPLSAADLPPSPTKSSNLSETAEVPACNVPSRSPLPALAIAPETKLGTASSGLGTLEP